MASNIPVLVAVAVTAAIQSVFGVGVLLFGTPILLILGYPFIETLTVLLPISVSINLLQIAAHWRRIDWQLFRKILLFTIPFVVACLVLVAETRINIDLIVGCFLLFVAGKDFSPRVGRAVRWLMRYERSYLVVMGVVHGLTNLGGSLLTALTHGKGYGKDGTRVTTAVGYFTFAVFQIGTLIATAGRTHVRLGLASHALYVGVGVAVYALVDRLLYAKLDDARYRRLFAVFLFASGCLLIYKAFTH
jgi:uncharacterized membrane protein YfcA